LNIQDYNFASGFVWVWSLASRVFENRVLRRIFGPRRNEVIRSWSKLHNEKLNKLYSPPIIIRMTKTRRMRCAGHVE
jgi:hypothetical protein